MSEIEGGALMGLASGSSVDQGVTPAEITADTLVLTSEDDAASGPGVSPRVIAPVAASDLPSAADEATEENNLALENALAALNSRFRLTGTGVSESSTVSRKSRDNSLADFIIDESLEIDMDAMYEMAKNRKPGEPNPMEQLTRALSMATQGVENKNEIDGIKK